MKLRSYFLGAVALLGTSALAVNAQVPGVNSTLATVFTMAYDNSTMMPTYSATIAGQTAVASATDQCTLTGSASKTVKVRRIFFTNVPTVAASEPIAIIKRSTASTGAGSTIPTGAYDSANPTSTVGLAEFWTAAPTVGTQQSVVADLIYSFAVAGTNVVRVFTFGELGQPVVLRGVAQSVSVNLNATTFTGTVGCTFEWTEQ